LNWDQDVRQDGRHGEALAFSIPRSTQGEFRSMKMVKIRETLAALFALALVVVLLAVIAHVFGFRIPGLIHITDTLGMGG